MSKQAGGQNGDWQQWPHPIFISAATVILRLFSPELSHSSSGIGVCESGMPSVATTSLLPALPTADAATIPSLFGPELGGSGGGGRGCENGKSPAAAAALCSTHPLAHPPALLSL